MTRLGRVRERAAFAALRRDGVRRRVGPLTVTRLATPAPALDRPAVAFAIGKPVGGAVVRNRLRRQLRSAIVEIDPAPATYLVSARPEAVTLSYQDLRGLLAEAMA